MSGFKLLRAVGGAVILGVGAKAGTELYEVIKKHTRRRHGCSPDQDQQAAETTVEGVAAVDEDLDAAEARLKSERQRINRELDRIRRARSKMSEE